MFFVLKVRKLLHNTFFEKENHFSIQIKFWSDFVIVLSLSKQQSLM